jgi:peptide/nickel transport system permease protein
MPGFVFARLMQAAIVLLAVSALVFVGVYVIGNPVDVMINPLATQAEKLAVAQSLGLDQPVWVQYGRFLAGALHADFGRSFRAGQPAMQLIFQRVPATLELAVTAILVATLVGVPLGLYAAVKPGAWISRAGMGFSIVGLSLPSFWIAIVLIMVLAVWAGVLPSSGRGDTRVVLGIPWSFLTLDGLAHIVLPSLTLALPKIALLARLTRAAAMEIVGSEYMQFARAKGLRRSRIVGVHMLRNLMVPLVTVIGMEFGRLAAFSVITESIFAWPGAGKLLIDSIVQLDRPVVVAYVMVVVSFLVVLNLVLDLLYGVLDPRIRLKASAA